jgi:phospholipase C
MPVRVEGDAVQIEHVVVLCLENRSFDHMLGYLDHPDPRFEGLRGAGPYDNVGWDGAERVAASDGAKRVLPFGPDHSHDAVMEQLGITSDHKPWRPTNQGFVTSYERKARGLAPPKVEGFLGPLLGKLFGSKPVGSTVAGRGPLTMLCQRPEQVPVLSRLALEFAVCDHWFCSVPGETWPNRNYLHAATSDGETDIELRVYSNPTIFELLEKNGKRWRVYHDDTPQLWAFQNLWDTPDRHGNWFPAAKFVEHAARGDLAAYSFIEPNHRPPFHTLDHQPILGGAKSGSTSQHPENNLVSDAAYDEFDDTADTDFARADRLIATIYEALRANPALFQKTMFVITYDEHGGLYDHVPPPADVPAPGGGRGLLGRILHAIWHRETQPFDFTMLGPRVPTVIVSPHIPAGTLIAETYDHASVPATLRAIFAPTAQPLTKRDAWAATFHHALSLDNPRTDLLDLSQHVTTTPAAATANAAAAETGAPTTAAATTKLGAEVIPTYYRDFLKQAERVRKHLRTVGEPEIQNVTPGSGGQSAAEVTAAFQEAAHRHRHTDTAG